MEQYYMPKKLDFKNLRFCLDNYEVRSIFIRLVGSSGGTIKVNEKLEGKILDFKKDKSGLYFFIDSKEIFHFPLNDYHDKMQKGFSLAYERIKIVDGHEQMVILGTGADPYDKNLPEPRYSFLRNVIDRQLLEIFFKGRVDLKFHSWWIKPYWKYWTVTK
jgi:hypothetical protein